MKPEVSAGLPPARNIFRARATGSVNARSSRLVTVMKVALPLLALAILATVVAWPSFVEQRSRKISAELGKPDLLRPRYYSVDDAGEPYSVVAQQARESATKDDVVHLVAPEAELQEKEGTWVTLRGETGDFDRKTRILHLIGSVHILRDDGTEYTTDEAYLDIAKGVGWGDGRIVGQGPQGEVVSQGFRLTDRGRTVIFLNRSTASLPGGGADRPKAEAVPAPAVSPPADSPPPTALPPASPPSVPPVDKIPAPEAKAPPFSLAVPEKPQTVTPIALPAWIPPLPQRKPTPP